MCPFSNLKTESTALLLFGPIFRNFCGKKKAAVHDVSRVHFFAKMLVKVVLGWTDSRHTIEKVSFYRVAWILNDTMCTVGKYLLKSPLFKEEFVA